MQCITEATMINETVYLTFLPHRLSGRRYSIAATTVTQPRLSLLRLVVLVANQHLVPLEQHT
jgi:hypothetical protein